MRISDWSSDVCSSVLVDPDRFVAARRDEQLGRFRAPARPRGAAAGAAQAELPSHGVADGAQGARHALGTVRDRLYLERGGRGVHDQKRVAQGQRGAVRYELGGARRLKKNNINTIETITYNTQ